MPEWTSLYLVLWCLRLIEYACWRPAGTVVFRQARGRGGTPIPRRATTGPSTGGIVFGNPLDPLEGIFVSGTAEGGRFQVDELHHRLRAYREATGPLLRAESILATHLFIVVPAAWATIGIVRSWPYLLAGAGILHVLTIALFQRAHRRICVSTRGESWLASVPFILAPPIATAAHVALTKPLARGQHPLAVASVLCDDTTFRDFAAPYLRRVEFPIRGPAEDHEPTRVTTGMRDQLRAVVAERIGNVDALLDDPVRRSPTAQTYCPRCLAEYSRPPGTCSDCPGVALKPFPYRTG